MKPSANEIAPLMVEAINNYYINSQGCWIHRNAPTNKWGHVKLGRRIKGKYYAWQAHRLSYALHVGYVSDNVFVNHECGVPNCVNFNHLYLGNAWDNNLDAHFHGVARPAGKPMVSLEQVEDMRFYSTMGLNQREIASIMGVSQATISKRLSGRY
jgi:hypothetical protein